MTTEGQWFMLPPAAHLCQTCARDHPPEMPHDRETFFYQTKFNLEHGRAPTWGDAMAHCDPEVQAAWTKELGKRGVTW